MMTEEEARGRWRPMVRLVVADSPSGQVRLPAPAGYNRSSMMDDGNTALKALLCLGSRCMMWRWAKIDLPLLTPMTEKEQQAFKIKNPRRGYCGLAGKGLE